LTLGPGWFIIEDRACGAVLRMRCTLTIEEWQENPVRKTCGAGQPFGTNDRKVAVFSESLILAQDERWRRA
jgi:hypothetical protein